VDWDANLLSQPPDAFGGVNANFKIIGVQVCSCYPGQQGEPQACFVIGTDEGPDYVPISDYIAGHYMITTGAMRPMEGR